MNQLYPWHRWLSSDGFTAVRGVDFHCSTRSFCSMLRQRAIGRGISLHVVTRDFGKIVDVTIYRPVEEEFDLFQEV